MAFGTAVIASNVTSLPEVVGDAGLLVDPHHVDSIHAAMRRIAEDESLRSGLVERGFRRVQDFTWDAMGVRANTALRCLGACCIATSQPLRSVLRPEAIVVGA